MGEALGNREVALRKLLLRHNQLSIAKNPKRFKTITAGRRFGKTFYGKDELAHKAINARNQPVWYIAPTYRQAKTLMWRPLKELIPKSYIMHKDETDLSLELRNGSTIALRGADNPDSLRGPGLRHALFDEVAFQDKYVWDVVRPMLADMHGTATFITTPKGYNWYYDLVMDNLAKESWAHFHFTTAEGGNVTEEEIEEARASMDPRMFRQEFEASFENLSGRVYYAFDRIENCVGEIEDNPYLPLKIGMDFNVDPMTATLATRQGAELHVFDEIVIPNGNTVLMSQTIRKRWPNRPIIVYPDPTGNSRHTNAPVGQTDFTLLSGFQFQIVAPTHPYSQTDKINSANAALLNAAGVRRTKINKKCKTLIKGLDGLTYLEGTSQPDKKSGLDHITDSFAYMACSEFPIAEPARRIKALI
jgi:hypothetical protein